MTKQPKTTATSSSTNSSGRTARVLTQLLFGFALTLALLVGPSALPASAQSVSEIADEIERSGSYLERDAAGLDDAVRNANQAGVAFVWLDRSGSDPEANALASGLVDEFRSRNSKYDTALVLFADNYAANSNTLDQRELDTGLDAALNGFADGDEAKGLSAFSNAVGQRASTTPTTIGSGSSNNSPQGSSGGGFGLGSFLLLGGVAAGAFWLFRRWRTSKKASEQIALDMEQDRAEIKEQLRDNADKIMSLGDRVIAKSDHEMITKYEKASQTYQQVSQSIDSATTPEEIDALDDQIDHAEWQLESIEAELDGRPIPPQPKDDDLPPPPAPSTRSQSSPNVKEDREAPGRSNRRTRPTTRPRSRQRTRTRSRSGGVGGGLGGILGSILVGAISNGGLGSSSRRSQRRRGGSGFGTGGLGGSIGTSQRGGGSLGRGGVLRRGGGSRSRSSGGRSIGGRSRSSGSRKF